MWPLRKPCPFSLPPRRGQLHKVEQNAVKLSELWGQALGLAAWQLRHGWGGYYRCPRCPSKNFGCINWLRPAGLTQGNALQCLTSEMGNHAAGVGVGTTPTQPSNSSVRFLIGPTTLEPNLRLFEWYHKLDSLFVYFLYIARIHDLGML